MEIFRRFCCDYKSYLNYEHEVRFLRAFYYFELVKRYQNIPLITKTLTQEEANEAEPSDAVTILNFIHSEVLIWLVTNCLLIITICLVEKVTCNVLLKVWLLH